MSAGAPRPDSAQAASPKVCERRFSSWRTRAARRLLSSRALARSAWSEARLTAAIRPSSGAPRRRHGRVRADPGAGRGTCGQPGPTSPARHAPSRAVLHAACAPEGSNRKDAFLQERRPGIDVAFSSARRRPDRPTRGCGPSASGAVRDAPDVALPHGRVVKPAVTGCSARSSGASSAVRRCRCCHSGSPAPER